MKNMLVSCTLFLFGLVAYAAEDVNIVPLSSKYQPCAEGTPKGCKFVNLRGDMKTGPYHIMYSFPAGTKFPKHWHDGSEDLIVVSGTLVVSSDNTPDKSMKAGDYLYVPAKLYHTGECTTACQFYIFVDGPESFHPVEQK